MRLSFQLKKILGQHHETGRGRVSRICEHTGLKRHQVTAMLDDKVQYLSMKSLAAICAYLIEFHQVDADSLPGALFGFEAGDFWSMINRHDYVEVSFGMRSDKESADHRWVMASDCLLHGKLIHEIRGLGAKAFEKQPKILEQTLAPAVSLDGDSEKALKDGNVAYQRFNLLTGKRALLCLGSVKSNVMTEVIMAKAFGCDPYRTQDQVQDPTDRNCPVYLRYRKDDVKPDSCHAGQRLAQKRPSTKPGIYYETASGDWEFCPCNDTRDAALVFYFYSPASARLEMVLGGFSGRATRCLATSLGALSGEFWPPRYDTPKIKIGAFVVEFEWKTPGGKKKSSGGKSAAGAGGGTAFLQSPSKTRVIPLSAEVFERRLGPMEERADEAKREEDQHRD